MAKPMSNTMHLRIELDAKKAQQGVEALNASMLSAVKNLQNLKGKGYADDSPEVKAVMNQIVGLKAIINQTLQSFRDIDAAIKNTAEVSRREIASLIKQNEKRADTLFPSDKDFKKDLAVMRERHEVLQRVYEQRKVSQRDFASALKNIANQTDDQLKVLIQQSEHAARSLQKGSVEMRQAYAAYKQFTDEQARRRGEQTYSSMIRAAGTQPDADQLRALKKEADTLMKSPLLNDESKNKLAVVIDGINEAIKRANPAPLRELDKVLKEIGSTTDLKGMEMLRLQLGGIIKAAADPKATDVMKTQIEKITKGIADPDTVNKLKEKITKLYSSISDPDVKAKAEEAVKGIFSSFTNPQALDDFRFQLEQAFSKLGDPIDVNKLMGNLESTFRHLTHNADIQKARDYMNNMFVYQDSPKKVETYKKGLEEIFNTLARNFPALKGEVEQAKGYIDQFYNAISDKSKADKITSNMHDLMMAIVDPEVRIQLEQMQKLLHDGSIVDPAKVTESKGLMKDLMAALADPARRGDLPTIIDQLNGTLLSQEKISAATEKFRQLGEQIKSATPRDLDAVMGDFMGGKRGKFSLEEMLRMRDEIQKRITNFGSVMPDAELEKSNAALKNMEQNILNISRNIADGSVKASYEDMKTALSVIEGKWKTLDPNVRKNQELIAALGTEYHKLKEAVDSWGRSVMSVDELQKNMTSARAMVEQARKDPASVQMDEYQRLMRVMADANNVDKVDVQTTREAAAIHREMTEILKGKTIAIISETEAERAEIQARKVLTDQEKATIADVRDTISLYQQMVNQDNITIEKKRELGATLKQLEDLYKGVAKAAVMSEADAIAAADKAQSLLTQIRNNGAGSVSLADVQTALQLTQDAQKAEEANLSVIQRNAALNRELTEAIKGKNVVTLEDTTIQKAQNDAAHILIAQEGALVGKVRDTIAIYQQMIAMDGQTIEKKRELGVTLKQLEDLYKGEVKGLKDVVEAQDAVFKLQNFINQAKRDPSAVNAQAMRDAVTAAKAVQNTRGVSVQLSREAAAAEAEATRILQAKNVVALDSTTIINAETEATRMLGLQEQANMGELKKVIEIYKQLVEQEYLDVKVKEERRKKLEELQKLEKGQYNLKAGDVKAQYNRLLDSNGEVRQNALTADINDTIKALQRLKGQYGVTREESVAYDAMIKKLEKSLRSETETTKKASSAAQQLAYDERFVANTLKNINKAPMEDLEKAILMCRNRMRDAQTSLRNYIKASMELKTVQAQMRMVNAEIQKQGDWFATNAKKLMNYLGVFGGFYLVRQELAKFFQASMKYDDQLTNIQKTTNLTANGIRLMADGIKHIDTRTSVEELQNLGYQAGKLGVNGVSDLLGFVRAADMLHVSLGEQLGDDAAEKLMKIANIMGDTDAYGLEEALTRTGSAITYMAKNSAASGDAIVAFMSRTAGLSRQAGITSSELTGLAAAVSALGQPVEMSATSFSKMMVQMEKSYKTVGAALKMTDREMETLRLNLESGRGMEAFLDMLKRVKELGGLSNTASIAKDLGSEGSRVIQTLTTLSSSYDTIARMVHQSTEAFEENITVQDEFRKKNENTAALYERLKNNFAKLFISQDANDWLRGILERLQVLPGAVEQLIDNFKGLASVIGNFTVNHINGLVNALSAMLYLLGGRSIARSVIGTVMNLVASFKLAADNIHNSSIPAIRRYNIALQGNIGLWKSAAIHAQRFFAICKAASIGNALFTVISILSVVYELFVNNEKKVKDWSDTTAKAIDRVKDASVETTEKMEALIKAHDAANLSEEEDLRIREQLQEMFGDYLGNLDLEKEAWDKIAEAVRGANEQLQANQILEATQAHIKEIRKQDSQDQAPEYGKLVEQVKQRLTASDDQVKENQAVAIVDAMIGNADRYAIRGKNGDYVEEKVWGNRFDPQDAKIQGNLNQLFESIAGKNGYIPVQQNLNDAVRAANMKSQSEDIDFIDELQDIFVPFVNSAENTDTSIKNALRLGNAQASQHIEKAMAWMKPQMEAQYKLFENSLSRGGVFDPETVRKERSGKNAQDATTDDWARDKRGVLDDQRNLESAAAKGWLNLAQNYLKDMRSQNGENPDTAEISALQNKISNVKAWLKIWDIGGLKTAPDDDADSKARREARQELDNIIQKIKTFYEIQAEEYKRMRLDQEISETQYQKFLQENEMNQLRMLSAARKAVVGDLSEQEYRGEVKLMGTQNIAGAEGEEAFGRVDRTHNLAAIGKPWFGNKEDGSAMINSIRRQYSQDEKQIYEKQITQIRQIEKAWLEQNPMGKISKQFQEEFETLGIMLKKIEPELRATIISPLVESMEEAEPEIVRTREQVQSDVMNAYREIGKNAFRYDVDTTEGVEAFRKYVSTFEDLAAGAAKATPETLRQIYYKSFEYADQYETQLVRIAERTFGNWTKRFEPMHRENERMLKDLENLRKVYSDWESYGLSKRFNLDATVQSRRQKYNDALAALQDKAQKVRDQKKAADALVIGDNKEAGEVSAEYKKGKQDAVEQEIKLLKAEGEKVVEIYGEVLDAQMAVRDAQLEWVRDMKDAFAKFADSFVPFREYYDKKGSFVKNVFGTKEERQKAFEQFVGDIKKAVRETLMEQAKLRVNKWLKLDEKAAEQKDKDAKPGQEAVDNVLGSFNTDSMDNETLKNTLDERLQIKTEAHLKEEEEDRRHQAEEDRIHGITRDEDGNVEEDGEDADVSGEKPSLDSASMDPEVLMEKQTQEALLSVKDAAQKKLEKKLKDGAKNIFKIKKDEAKKEQKIDTQTAENKEDVEKGANEAVEKIVETTATAKLTTKKATAKEEETIVKTEGAIEQTENIKNTTSGMWGNFGVAMSKAFAVGGPIMGPIYSALISAALGSLMTMVMNMLGSSSKTPTPTKTKLVTGMLTYDSGNVQSFPVMGDDGRVYNINNVQDSLPTGMVTKPTLTTVNGQPALVGERGPEMVIGRETTRAMMMYAPDLLQQISLFDRHRSNGKIKTYDEGNASAFATAMQNSQPTDRVMTGEELREMMLGMQMALAQSNEVNAQLAAQLQRGIKAHINKYGPEGLVEEVASGFVESRQLRNNKNITRLFG